MAAKKKPQTPRARAVITLRVSHDLHKRLRIAAAYNDMTIQDLVLNGAKLVLGVGP